MPEGESMEGATGSGEYVVAQGDCIASIAFERGLFWKTIWDHPQNRSLKEKRKDPNILLPGDKVYIPERSIKEVTRPTGARHRFRRKGVPEKLSIALYDSDGEPRRSLPYTLIIDGSLVSGTTDSQGRLEHAIPPNARSGELIIEAGAIAERYTLRLGGLDPISSPTGVQARLNNLGFDCGEVDGRLGPETRQAIERFQERYKLPLTGELDDETRRELSRVHGF